MKNAKKFGVPLGRYLAVILILVFFSACVRGRSSESARNQGLGLVSSQEWQKRLGSARNGHQESSTALPQKFQASFSRLSLSFIPNRGQVDERVRFYGKSGSACFFFARAEVVYTFIQGEKEASPRKVDRSAPNEDSGHRGEKEGRGHVVRLRFVGANPDAGVEGEEELPGKVSYFTGSDPTQWKRGLPTYGRVRYRGLWPGIDLVYRGQGGRLKYEFVVKPGADPSRIRLAYRGIEGMSVNNAGDLILKTAFGELRDSQPYAYQEIGEKRVAVEASFRVEGRGSVDTARLTHGRAARPTSISGFPKGSRYGLELSPEGASQGGPASLHGSGEGVALEGNIDGGDGFVHGFEVKGYDLNYPLILDPGLDYSTFLGGSNGDAGLKIALDGVGNAYVTGDTASANFPTTPGAYDTSYNGGPCWNRSPICGDAFVAKLSFTGSTLIYATFLGGGDDDGGYGIAVDMAGNAHVTGGTFSSGFPTTPGAYDSCYNGGSDDVFVARLSSNGSTLLYSTFLGGSGSEWGRVALDEEGNAYVTGGTSSLNFPTTPGAYDTSHNGGSTDAFVAKLSLPASSPGLALGLNQTAFRQGDTLILTATITPGDVPQTVDVYVAVLLPDGGLLFLQGDGSFTRDIRPIVASWTVAPYDGEVFRYTFGGGEPPGDYAWLAAFAEPGTLDFIMPIAEVPFRFSP
ncbi:MAG: SBBP repeat-containing protein [Candidatus Tectomicrobia bacterium]|uniref:SBBP repeat-containing protein n=1 Tax=Tectimicrobiota bacterium TaxID=2528274 RepID=A0A932CPL5_UNCTE|nr:SBBP repeat-containing protein [Candidatus Tectomicrobia bacterium]